MIAIAPHDVETVAKFLAKEPMPFPVLADPDHTVFDRYDVASRALSLGQRPAAFFVCARACDDQTTIEIVQRNHSSIIAA